MLGRGGVAIIEPTWGEVIAGPVYDEEKMLIADCALHAKRRLDAVGHCSREEVLVRSVHAPPPSELGAACGEDRVPISGPGQEPGP